MLLWCHSLLNHATFVHPLCWFIVGTYHIKILVYSLWDACIPTLGSRLDVLDPREEEEDHEEKFHFIPDPGQAESTQLPVVLV